MIPSPPPLPPFLCCFSLADLDGGHDSALEHHEAAGREDAERGANPHVGPECCDRATGIIEGKRDRYIDIER